MTNLATLFLIKKNRAIRNAAFIDKYLFLGFALLAGLLFAYFAPLLLHLNEVLFAASGDGLKNFYTLCYYVKYDTGFWFSGMLYPYGEHVLFTDNQPLLAFALNFVQHHFINLSPYLLGIVNALLFLNLFACFYFVHKTLALLRLPGGYSMLCALLITCMAPTLFRIPGHFSLSYSSLLAATIYLLALNESQKRIYRIVLLAMVSFFSGWLHPYWAIITGMVILSFWFVKLVFERKINLPLFLAGVAGPLLFKISLTLTDPVTDRPQDPWGAAEYAAQLSSVFFPVFPFYQKLRGILHLSKPEYESISYVGWAGIFFLALLIVKFFFRWKKTKRVSLSLPGAPFLQQLFLSGILILLLAMFFPFRFGMEDMFYKIPFLNQFRSLGRFAWAFYFILAIYSAYGFWLVLRKIRMKKGKTAFALCAGLLFSVWFSDVHFSFRHVLGKISAYGGRNSLVENRRVAELLAASGFTPGDFQAALPYPIPAEGSEKLWFSGEWLTKWSSLAYSCQTGTPVLGGILSRTSVSRTLQLMSLTGSDFSEKKIALDFPSDLPVLVIAPVKTDTSSFLIKRSRKIAQNDEITLYLLEKANLLQQTSHANSMLQNFIPRENFYANTTPEKVLYWTNENMGNDFSGLADSIKMLDKKTFATSYPVTVELYSLSCWIKVTPSGNKVPFFNIREYEGDRKITQQTKRPDFGTQLDVSGNWIRFDYTFVPLPYTSRIEVEVHGENSIVDHFLLKPRDVHVVVFPERMQGKALDNNFLANIYPGF